jgi:NADH:ubiquinone oxidoreductase subunit D
LINIGICSYQTCLNYGLTGVLARCSGIKRDLRLDSLETYANYYYLNFRSYVGQHGDSYDRFLLRMNEMTESLNIINQVISKITNSFELKKTGKNVFSKNVTSMNPHQILKYLYNQHFNDKALRSEYSSMESLINHFKF